MTRFDIKLGVFVRFALDLAQLSSCTRLRVGCVICTSDLTEVLSIGYNGPRRGAPNGSCRGPGAVGACGCVHAEANALVKLSDRRPATLITTTSPCEACASLIVNRGTVEQVLYLEEYRQSFESILRESGIQVRRWTQDDLRCSIRQSS